MKLHPDDLYALGVHRGGIDERWFACTNPADNPGAPPDEGLSYIVSHGDRFTLREAVAACGPALIGQRMWEEYGTWPVMGKLFDNMGPLPHHLHQSTEQVKDMGKEGKPEAYYFPPQLNQAGNGFPYTFFGLEPGTTREMLRRCLEAWDKGDNGILDHSRAYRLRPGTGWLLGPRILHAPGSFCTFEVQWASDVFAMFQNVLEGRPVPWDLLVKDVADANKRDLDFIVNLLDWEANLDPHFKTNHYLEPCPDGSTEGEGYMDRWVVYGRIGGRQLFTVKELLVNPGVKVTIQDPGAYGLITMQGRGTIGNLALECPSMIRFGEMTHDEFFVSESAAMAGVAFENLSGREPMVTLRYFGPDANPAAPGVGAHGRPG